MKLKEILKGVDIDNIISNKAIDKINISNICYNSREIRLGGLFIAISGYETDGHKYINEAINGGAIAVIVDKECNYDVDDNIIYIVVNNPRKQMAVISANFYKNPDKKLKIIGITGTKGKTTVTYMIREIFKQENVKIGLIGTIYNIIGRKTETAKRSTPESMDVFRMFSELVQKKQKYVVMEVTAHALSLYRVYGLTFEYGIFLNLTQDHLDFYHTMEEYYKTKKSIFLQSKRAIINIDDKYGQRLYTELVNENIISPKNIKTFGVKNSGADCMASGKQITSKSVKTNILLDKKSIAVEVSIPGEFTIYNAMPSIIIAKEYGISNENIVVGLENVRVPGRSEVLNYDLPYTIMIDFAHSPGSLENILQAVRVYAKGKIICVFGCSGKADKLKRPVMGEIATRLADFSIITEDNPADELQCNIANQIESGIKDKNAKYIIINDRKEAIEYALNIAEQNDIVILAGKGHETYQIVGDTKVRFSEKDVVREYINKIKSLKS